MNDHDQPLIQIRGVRKSESMPEKWFERPVCHKVMRKEGNGDEESTTKRESDELRATRVR